MSEIQIQLPHYYYIDASTSLVNMEHWGKIEMEQHTRVTRREDAGNSERPTYAVEVVPYPNFEKIKNNKQFDGLFDHEVISNEASFNNQYKLAKEFTDIQYKENEER